MVGVNGGKDLVHRVFVGDGQEGAQKICHNVLNASIQSSIESKSILAVPLTVILQTGPPAWPVFEAWNQPG